MTAYQLQLLTGSGISRQEVLGPLCGSILDSNHVRAALSLQAALMQQDGLAFLHVMQTAPHLMQCLAHMHIRAMQCVALEQLTSSHPPTSAHPSFSSGSLHWTLSVVGPTSEAVVMLLPARQAMGVPLAFIGASFEKNLKAVQDYLLLSAAMAQLLVTILVADCWGKLS